MNTEERQLAEMLHRVTPEPPRRVTVEDVAFRLAKDAGRGAEPRPRRGFPAWHRGWAPVLAAASVFVVAGASAGIAELASHHSPAPRTGNAVASASASASTAPAQSPTSTGPTWPPVSVAGGMWGAELINRQTFFQGSLVGGANSLYAMSPGYLDRISPVTGDVLTEAPYSAPVPNPPVVMGNTVWVVWIYGGGTVVLHGYDARTLAQVASLSVPAIGRVSSTASTVLTGGPDGNLYLAAGDTVAVVDPATGHLIRRMYLTAGPADSVAVSPDGSRLYVGVVPSTPAYSFQLLTYDLATGVQTASSRMASGGAGNLVATSGGVWGTTGTGMSEWVWFAPNGDLTRMVRISQGAGGGLASVPSLSGGAVWIGGSHTLECADPATGQARASVAIPADNSIVEYFGSVAVTGGRTYALYQDVRAQLSGLATLTPPAQC